MSKSKASIVIDIEQVGLEILDEIEKRFESLQDVVESINFDNVFGDVTVQVDSLGGKLKQTMTKTIDSIANTGTERAVNSIDTVQKEALKAAEFINAFGLSAGLLLVSSVKTQVNNVIGFLTSSVDLKTKLSLIKPELASIFEVAKVGFGESLNFVLSLRSSMFEVTEQIFLAGQGMVGLSTTAGSFAASVASIAGLTAGVVGQFTSIFIIKEFLASSVQLTKRLLFLGTSATTPMEKGTQLISIFESGLTKANLSAGQLFKTFLFGGLTLSGGGIFTAIPFINNAVTSLIQKSTLFRSSFGALFGGAKGQLTFILVSLREMLQTMFPVFQVVQKSITRAIFGASFIGVFLRKFQSRIPIVGNLFLPMNKTLKNIKGSFNSFISMPKIIKDSGVALIGMKTTLDGSFKVLTSTIDSIKKIKTVDVISNVTKAIDSVKKSLANINETTEKKLLPSADKIVKSIETVSNVIRTQLTSSFDKIKNIPKEMGEGFSAFGKEVSQIKGFFASIQNLKSGSNIADMKKNFEGLIKAFTELNKRLPSGAKVDLSPFVKAMDNLGKLSKDAVIKAGEDVQKALKTGNIASAGDALIREFNKSFRQGFGSAEFIRSLDAFAALIMSFVPQSPAKRGPLKGLTKSGTEIVRQLSKGIFEAKGLSEKAAGDLAKQIAAFFPQSPAKKGVLRNLPNMGKQIVVQLSSGIKSGFGGMVETIKSLVNVITTPIQNILEFSDLSFATGIDANTLLQLDTAARSVGASVTDITTTFERFQRIMDSDNNIKFASELDKIGISLAQVQNSANPTLTMIIKLADASKNLGIRNEELRGIFQKLGITVQSKILKLFAKGGDEIERLMALAIDLGLTINEETLKTAKAVDELFQVFKRIKVFIFQEFFTPILPKAKEILDGLLNKAKQNSVQHKAILLNLGEALVAAIEVGIDGVKFLLDDSKEGAKKTKDLVTALTTFAEKTIVLIRKIFTKEVRDSLKQMALLVINFAVSMGSELSDRLGVYVDSVLVIQVNRFLILILEIWETFIIDVIGSIPGISRFLTPIRSGFIKAKAFLANGIVELSKQAQESLDIGNFVETSFGKAVTATDEFIEKAAKLGEQLNASTDLEEFSSTFDELIQGMGDTIKGSQLEQSIEKLKEIISQENFARIKEEIKSTTEQLKNDLTGVIPVAGQIAEALTLKTDEKEQKDRIEKLKALKEMKDIVTDSQDVFSEFGKIANNVFDIIGKESKAAAIVLKSVAIGEAIIQTSLGIIAALAQGAKTGNFALANTMAVLIGITGATSVAKIAAQGFADGGLIKGGSGNADDVNLGIVGNNRIMAMGGEFIHPKNVVNRYGINFMESVRTGKFPLDKAREFSGLPNLSNIIPSSFNYANGGGIPNVSSSQSEKQDRQINLTNVNVVDPSIVRQFLNSSDGRNSIINILAEEKNELKQIVLND